MELPVFQGVDETKMRVYVASKAENYQRVREVQQLFKDAGHHITYDWTPDVEKLGPGAGLQEAKMRECAIRDKDGVWRCQLLAAICFPGWLGTLLEVGMGLAWDKPIWLIRDEPVAREPFSIFWTLYNVEVIEWENLVGKITSLEGL